MVGVCVNLIYSSIINRFTSASKSNHLFTYIHTFVTVFTLKIDDNLKKKKKTCSFNSTEPLPEQSSVN